MGYGEVDGRRAAQRAPHHQNPRDVQARVGRNARNVLEQRFRVIEHRRERGHPRAPTVAAVIDNPEGYATEHEETA
jgi:hypothetical protein